MNINLEFHFYNDKSPCDITGYYQGKDFLVYLLSGSYEVASFTLDNGFCWNDDSVNHEVSMWAELPAGLL